MKVRVDGFGELESISELGPGTGFLKCSQLPTPSKVLKHPNPTSPV